MLIKYIFIQRKFRDRDIKRLKFDRYRRYPDISVIVGFINNLFSVQEQDMFIIP